MARIPRTSSIRRRRARVLASLNVAPVNTVAPAITGTTTKGQTLTSSTGTWTGATSYAYQWFRAITSGGSIVTSGGLFTGALISGATASTYVSTQSDVGELLYCEVTATGAGSSTMQQSNATSAIADTSPRTNLALQSENFGAGLWNPNGTVTVNQVNSPTGTLTADQLTYSDSSVPGFAQAMTMTNGQAYTYSIYLRAASAGTWPINFYDGTNHHRVLLSLTTSWQRFSITATAAGTSGFIYPGDKRAVGGDVGTGTLADVYAWGAQFETGSVATSYIGPTGATPVTV